LRWFANARVTLPWVQQVMYWNWKTNPSLLSTLTKKFVTQLKVCFCPTTRGALMAGAVTKVHPSARKPPITMSLSRSTTEPNLFFPRLRMMK